LAITIDGNNTPTLGGVGYGDGSELAFSAAGTAGQVLTSAGGAAPTWGTAAPIGATVIASGSFPSAAVLDITNIPQTYSYLFLQVIGASSTGAAAFLYVQVSVNNGSSFDSTASSYPGVRFDASAVNSLATASMIKDASSQGIAEVGNAALVIQGYQNGMQKKFSSRSTHTNTDISEVIGTYVGSTSGINALRILWSVAGNFDAGTYALYGMA
jgi:hypothetical protein